MKRLYFAGALSFLLFGFTVPAPAQDRSLQYYNAGNSFYSQKDYDKAISYYHYATQLNPDLWQAYQGLGNSYYAKGDKSTALASYQKSLALHPDNPQLTPFVQSLQAQLGSAPPSISSSEASPESQPESTPAPTHPGTANPIELDILPGGNLILSATNPVPNSLVSSYVPSGLKGGYGAGFGGGSDIYFPISRNFSIGANTAFYAYGANYHATSSGVTYGYSYTESVSETVSQSNLEVLAAAKYRFDGQNLQPYLLGGVGFSLVSYSGSVSVQATISGYSGTEGFPVLSGSQLCPMALVGGGIQFPAGNNMNFFAEIKLGIVLIGSTTQTVNGSYGGYTYNGQYQTASSTLLELPINAGLNFDL